MHKRLPLILGVVLAVIAIILVKFYLDRETQIIREQTREELVKLQETQTTVLVANRDIPKGATIEAGMLKTRTIPREYAQPQAVTSPERIIGMMTIAPIAKDEQITLNKLSSIQEVQPSTLAMATPVGKRAVSIPVDNITSLMGMIRPGDYVDVVAMVPVPVQTAEGQMTTRVSVVTLFQNVLVLAAGQETRRQPEAEASRYGEKKSAEIASLITLALTPQEANLIAFVQEQGKIRLILRSPADAQIKPTTPASWETLFRHVMPELLPEKPEEKETPGGYIEIYRGLERETVPISR